MGIQKGLFPLQATLGNVTFYKSQDGFRVKSKSAVSKSKIMSDPKFKRTRENMAEFGNACLSGKILRIPFKPLLKQAADNRMISRLTKKLMTVLKTDTVNQRGHRLVKNGDLTLLAGFEFNDKAIMGTTFTAPYTLSYVRATGTVDLDLESFIPAQVMQAPDGATGFALQLAAAAVDFTSLANTAQISGSDILILGNTAVDAFSLSVTLPAASLLPVFIVLSIGFLEQVNGSYYSLQNGSFNACALIKIDLSAPL